MELGTLKPDSIKTVQQKSLDHEVTPEKKEVDSKIQKLSAESVEYNNKAAEHEDKSKKHVVAGNALVAVGTHLFKLADKLEALHRNSELTEATKQAAIEETNRNVQAEKDKHNQQELEVFIPKDIKAKELREMAQRFLDEAQKHFLMAEDEKKQELECKQHSESCKKQAEQIALKELRFEQSAERYSAIYKNSGLNSSVLNLDQSYKQDLEKYVAQEQVSHAQMGY